MPECRPSPEDVCTVADFLAANGVKVPIGALDEVLEVIVRQAASHIRVAGVRASIDDHLVQVLFRAAGLNS